MADKRWPSYHRLIHEVFGGRDVVIVADVGDVIARTLRPDPWRGWRNPDNGIRVRHLHSVGDEPFLQASQKSISATAILAQLKQHNGNNDSRLLKQSDKTNQIYLNLKLQTGRTSTCATSLTTKNRPKNVGVLLQFFHLVVGYLAKLW